MRNKLFTNIGIILFGIALIFFVIRPKFEMVQAINEESETYREALRTATEVQRLLSDIDRRIASIDRSNMRALETYIPNEVDSLSVSRDLVAMGEASGMIVESITAEEVEMPEPEDTNRPQLDSGARNNGTAVERPLSVATTAELTSQEFAITLLGTYEDMKRMLEAVEQNHYPLRVTALDFATEEAQSTILLYTLRVEAYALPFE